MLRLISVRLFLGQAKLEAIVEEEGGKRRQIEYKWLEAGNRDVPPASWFETVCGEAELRRGEEGDSQSGRGLFRAPASDE